MQSLLAAKARETPPINWVGNADYRDFRERLWEVNHDDEELPPLSGGSEDDDLMVAASRQTLICPLTQTIYSRPVTNPTCGHTYSRDAIVTMARSGGSIPCPLHGCNAHVIVSRLHANEAIERRIARKKQIRIFD